MLPAPATIAPYGFTGYADNTLTDQEREKANHRVYEVTRQLIAERPGEHRADLLAEVLAAVAIAAYQNHLAGLVAAYNTAERAARAAVQDAENAYAELAQRTTTAWHAAHHRYIAAAVAARDALAAKAEARTHLAGHHAKEFRHGLMTDFYEKVVPENQRVDLTALTALTETPDTELDLFTERQRARMQLLAHTLNGSAPAGFEPAAAPQTEDAPESPSYNNW